MMTGLRVRLPLALPGSTVLAMTPYQFPSFMIVGITDDGARFRPSAWAERLAGALSTINVDRRMIYSRHAQPSLYERSPCVFVSARIRETEPSVYAFLLSFARDNALKRVPWEP